MNDFESSMSLQRTVRLKNLLSEGLELEKNINQQSTADTLNTVRKIVTESNDIIKEGRPEDRAEHTTEFVLDAQVLKMNHELVSRVIRKSSVFDDKLYRNAIAKMVFKDDEGDWERLAVIACGIAHTVRSMPSMLGAIDAEFKERVVKERRKTKRKTLAEEACPENIERLDRQDKGAKKVNIIHKQLAEIYKANNREPIPYYKLIIDPRNFMSTVENAFQIAFLARDNLIGIERGEDGFPAVRLLSSSEVKVKKESLQSICKLNLRVCQEMQVLYDIKQPLLNLSEADEET